MRFSLPAPNIAKGRTSFHLVIVELGVGEEVHHVRGGDL